MVVKYNCANVDRLCDLYKIREMWCPTYSKKYWSGVILSSQRSETTNKSVSQRLNKTQGLCDFYHVFLDVISEWRSKEGGNDSNTLRGNRHLAFTNIGILVHARSLYTIQAYVVFEEEFIKGIAYDYLDSGLHFLEYGYHLWRPGKDLNKNEVVFNKETHAICCTCMFFSEMGLLCSHALRVYHLHYVRYIPQKYIVKRWTKAAMCSHGIDEPTLRSNVSSSVWRSQRLRKYVKLVTSCQNSLNARAEVDYFFNLLKEKVKSVTGSIDFNELAEGIEIVDLEINNPPKSRPTGERNLRPKSTLEKECNKVRGNWRKRKSVYTPYKRSKGQAVVQELDENGCPISYSNSFNDPTKLIVLKNPVSKVGNNTVVVDDIPSSSKESNQSFSNDFDQASGESSLQSNISVDLDISYIAKEKDFNLGQGVSFAERNVQADPNVPNVQSAPSVQKNSQVSPRVPINVQNAPRTDQVAPSVPRNVQNALNVPTNVQVAPSVPRNVQNASNVQAAPSVPRSVQGGSGQISSKYDRLLDILIQM